MLTQRGLQPARAVIPVRTAILRLDETSSTLTSNHTLFAELCVLAGAFEAALPILDRDITSFPQQIQPKGPLADLQKLTTGPAHITVQSGLSAKLTADHHLKYHLLGGIIYTELRHAERAMLFLEIVISAPITTVPSKTMVEGYKKWIILNLLEDGSVSSQPPVAAIHAWL